MYVHPDETCTAKYFKLLRIARAYRYIEAVMVAAIKEKYAFYEWC